MLLNAEALSTLYFTKEHPCTLRESNLPWRTISLFSLRSQITVPIFPMLSVKASLVHRTIPNLVWSSHLFFVRTKWDIKSWFFWNLKQQKHLTVLNREERSIDFVRKRYKIDQSFKHFSCRKCYCPLKVSD